MFGAVVYALSLAGYSYFSQLTLSTSLLFAFALSFSSTVFAVKMLEEKAEMASNHGRLAIGILIMQDFFAVIFITFSSGKVPSPLALGLVALFFLKKPLGIILDKSGHGELLVLLACILPIAGASVFEYVGLKPDLGALILGMIFAGHPKTDELAKAMFGFKDLFLVGFFLTIGMADLPQHTDAEGRRFACPVCSSEGYFVLPVTDQVSPSGKNISDYIVKSSQLQRVRVDRWCVRGKPGVVGE